MSTFPEISNYRPKELDDSLTGLRTTLDFFHRENDRRAIYVRAYYLYCLNVQQATLQRGRYSHRIFFDAEWVKKVMGRLSTQYFLSLTTQERPGERAWKAAHRMALAKNGSVLQELMLGLNAHVHYDLAYALYLSIRRGKEDEQAKENRELKDPVLLARRRFDHDQLNNLLIDTLPTIQQVLTRDYDAEMRGLGELVLTLEEVLATAGLKNYRERVWGTTLSLLAASSDEEVQMIRDRQDWESNQVARFLIAERNVMQRSVGNVLKLLRKKSFGPISIEQEGAAPIPVKKNGLQAAVPF